MFLSAYLAILCSQLPVDARAGENKLTQLPLKLTAQGLFFEWADEEDSLRGQVSPNPLRAGEPLSISAVLQPIHGPDLEVPLTFSLRPLGEMGAPQVATVPRAKEVSDAGGPRGWVATFTPPEPGEYRIEISWRSTHHKVLRGVVAVGPSGLPRWATWVTGGAMLAIALGIGLWILFGRQEQASS